MNLAEVKETEPIPYWGIECRTCHERIVLGIRRHPRYGKIFAFLKPGTFQCAHGHKHNYFRDDLIFVQPNPPVADAQIEKNRSRYHWIGLPDLG
jgi:hypothetical protein